MRLKELGERRIVEYVKRWVKRLPGSSLPIGDDAADIPPHGRLLASIDMLVQSTDIPEGMGWRDVGYRAVTGATSDVAAKGGRPVAYLISLALPGEMGWEGFKELWRGIEEAAEFYGAAIIGGDTNAGKEVIVDVACLAETPQKPIPRNGARPGDLLAVTGLFGAQAAGLHALMNHVKADVAEEVIARMLRPVARVSEGVALSSSGATSSIDSSDGLAETLHMLAEASGVGFRVDSPPVDSLAQRYSREVGVSLFDLVFMGGEEYELVVTVEPERWEEAVEAVEKVGGRLHRIGVATERRGEVMTLWEGRWIRVPSQGFKHFEG